MMKSTFNSRVLVVDDDVTVRQAICTLLQANQGNADTELSKASATLFDGLEEAEKAPQNQTIAIEVDQAESGEQGFKKIKAALDNGRPYAFLLLDMRMPGWDGLKTATKVREIDKQVEIFIVTAYSDYSLSTITEDLGMNVGYLSKPFQSEELLQAVLKGLFDWNRLRELEQLTATVSSFIGVQEPLAILQRKFHEALHSWLGARSSYLFTGNDLLIAASKISAERVDEVLRDAGCSQENLQQFLALDKNLEVSSSGILISIDTCTIVAALESRCEPYFLSLTQLLIDNLARILEMAELNEKVRQQQNLSLVGEAAAKVVHDLRNPLFVVDCALSRLEKNDFLQRDRERYLPMMYRNLKQANLYLDDILDVFRHSKVQTREQNIADFLSQIFPNLQFLGLEAHVEVLLEEPPNHTVLLDADKLERAITNIATNSIKATAKNEREHKIVKLSVAIDESSITIAIEDNGRGIPPEIAETIFTPFSTHGHKEGVGLGGYIAQQVVENHNGSIWFETGDSGTTFFIKLPCES